MWKIWYLIKICFSDSSIIKKFVSRKREYHMTLKFLIGCNSFLLISTNSFPEGVPMSRYTSMEPRNDLERRSVSKTYYRNIPKLPTTYSMPEHEIYSKLSQIQTSDFFGLCTDQIKALLPFREAKRYLNFLIYQNNSNKSGLDRISER